jgi:hypothetical protein
MGIVWFDPKILLENDFIVVNSIDVVSQDN